MHETPESEATTDITPPAKPSWLSRRVKGLVDAGTVIGVTMTVVAWFARWHWVCDLATHFPLQLAMGGATCTAVQALMRRWRWASVSLVATLLNVWLLAPYLWFAPSTTVPPEQVHKFISANLLRENLDYERFVQFVRDEKPDVLFVMEMNEAWTQALEVLQDEYPHQKLRPREDAFGVGLFSRTPFEDVPVILSATGLPSIVTTMELSGQEALFIGTHSLPPMGAANAYDRNEQLANIAQFVAQQKQPVVLLGDLNITPWSPYFGDLVRDSGLRDTQHGQGLQPSWPWLPWPCRIPIDHALVSKEVQVIDRRLGPNIGSDHLPVVLEFVLE